ncbi:MULTISPECIES: SPFH domain-containing protein [Vibrio]|uniref:SPFH domain-containing protein n=1 Tax=Vibrio TaxID=662 RepID=UPI00078BD9ED|nr:MULTISPECIES: SPFH domain-containing protein [Vibrio]BAU70775.1 hypothetical protein [Vibrio sp. 04Ya108]BBM67656.1 hypothetical protein VA249_43020 [Vibrio alfacsensis]BCN27138.1 hypothetical protein VYA_43300 [Vibrio alfacsensis]
MLKSIKVLVAVSVMSALSGCVKPTSIDAGVEGVLIKKPWFFGTGGVESKPLQTGLTWTAMSTSVVGYNIKPYKIEECFEDLSTADNVPVDFCSYITLKQQAGMTPKLHELSGKNWYENKLKDVFRTEVRNQARNKTSSELRTDSNVITNLQASILEEMRGEVLAVDLPVDIVKVIIGKVIPPKEVLAEAARTAAQKQRVKTQNEREQAELSRKKAEIASAQADKAYAAEFSMTTEQFLRNKELEIMSIAVQKGKTDLIINASNATPVFNVK